MANGEGTLGWTEWVAVGTGLDGAEVTGSAGLPEAEGDEHDANEISHGVRKSASAMSGAPPSHSKVPCPGRVTMLPDPAGIVM